MGAWEKLVRRYANGRAICNCGAAYYSNTGEGILNGERRNDLPDCQYGCSANQIFTQEEIAKLILAELDKAPG